MKIPIIIITIKNKKKDGQLSKEIHHNLSFVIQKQGLNILSSTTVFQLII